MGSLHQMNYETDNSNDLRKFLIAYFKILIVVLLKNKTESSLKYKTLNGHSDGPFNVLFLRTRNLVQNSHDATIIYFMYLIYAFSILSVILDLWNLLMIYAHKTV